jgi:endothelin-converting enzyme/putative endopeptidase
VPGAPAAEAVEAVLETPHVPRFGSFGFDTAGMDPSVHPGDDFYRWANGGWDASTAIPGDRARWGMFDLLTVEAEAQVMQVIVEMAAEEHPADSDGHRIAGLWQSWMDTDTLDARGLAPVTPWLDRIRALDSHGGLAALMGEHPFPRMVAISISPDADDPTVHVVRAWQSGLGMPDREYYLDPGERFEAYRQAWTAHVETLLTLAGEADAAPRAAAVVALETEMARAHWTRVRSRQVEETWNPMDVAAFADLAPALALDTALQTLGLGAAQRVIVAQPDAVRGLGQVFAGTPAPVLRDWMLVHFLNSRASWLPRAFDEAHFHFYGRTLAGTEEQRPRDRRGAELVGSVLGHPVGKVWAERHFGVAAQAGMADLVGWLLRAFEGRLADLAWMDEPTRQEALAKLDAFEPRIGLPGVWDDFSGVLLAPDDLFGNRMRLQAHAWQEQLARFPDPVDRQRWFWPPQMVNASYSSLMNQITFPAGILQPPFFDVAADPALNFGAIGGVIGHEIGHGFDDQGRRFDGAGRLRDWWTEETNARFEVAAGRLADQFSAICPLEDLCINGRLALGENIGDLGGLQMAWAAWQAYAADRWPQGDVPVIDGLTGDQRFFLGWAQVWRVKYREDAMRSQLVNGPHAPGMFRVNGVVRNLDAWYQAFGVDASHALWLLPEERVRIW